MNQPTPRRRRTRLIILVVLVCVVTAGAVKRLMYVCSPAFQESRALLAIQREDWATAEIHLKNLIGTNPNDANARLALADVYRNMAKKADPNNPAANRTDPPQAVEQLFEVARLLPKEANVRLRLFRTLMRTGKREAAAQIAQQLASLGSKDIRVLEVAMSDDLDHKRWDEAESLLERLKELRSDTPVSDLILSVRLYEGRGDTEKIEPLLRPLLRELNQRSLADLESLTEGDLSAFRFLMRAAVGSAPDGASASQLFVQSLNFLEKVATTDFGKSKSQELIEISAELWAVTKSTTLETQKKRQFASDQFYKFAEPSLETHQASPLVYEQLARATMESKDPSRALLILRNGIEQHRQLPPERQRELLALHRQAAQILLGQGRFAEAQANLVELLKHSETAPIGNFLAAAVALDEGRYEDAKRHVSQGAATDDPAMFEALQIRIFLATQDWKSALNVLEGLDRKWDSISASDIRWLTGSIGGREQIQLLQAQCLDQLGQSDRSESLLKRLERGPVRVQVLQARVLAALKRGLRREAWELLRAARHEFPADRRLVWIEFSLLVEEKAPEAAARLLASHIHRVPQDLSIRLLMVQWLMQRGETVSVLPHLAEIRQLFPDQPAGWLLAADVLLNTDRTSELDQLVKEMRGRPAIAPLVSLVQARRSLRKAGLSEAEAALRAASPELQRTAEFSVTAAAVALSQGKSEQAFDMFSKTLHFTGIRADVRDGFLQAFERALQTVNIESLDQRVEELRKQFPDEPAILLASAEMAMKRRDFPTAAQRIGRLAEVDSAPGRPEFTRARLRVAQGKTAEALTDVQNALKKVPQHPAARLLAAQLEFALGHYDACLNHLGLLATPLGDEPEPTLLRSEAFSKLGRGKEAEQALVQLTVKYPKLAQGWLALANLRNGKGPPDVAVRTLEEGLAQTSDRRALQSSVVELLLRSRQTDEALAASRRFSTGHTDPELCLYWARIFLTANQFQPAEEWLKVARKYSNPPSAELLFFEAIVAHQRAIHERRNELFQEARVRYGKLLEQYPGHVPSMNNLAWLLLRQFNEPAEALGVVEQLRIAVSFESMTPDLLDTVIEVYSKSGRHAEALDLATKSLARFPNAPVLSMQYAAALLDEPGDDAQRRELARKHLERARSEGVPPHRQADLAALLDRANRPPMAK